jgi:hypothetical protein
MCRATPFGTASTLVAGAGRGHAVNGCPTPEGMGVRGGRGCGREAEVADQLALLNVQQLVAEGGGQASLPST